MEPVMRRLNDNASCEVVCIDDRQAAAGFQACAIVSVIDGNMTEA